MTKNVYVALIEVAPLDPDALGEGIVGGFVRCYAPATDPGKARRAIATTLNEAGVRIVEVEWCVRDDEVDWDDPENVDGRSLVAEALTTQQTILGEFHVWADDEADSD